MSAGAARSPAFMPPDLLYWAIVPARGGWGSAAARYSAERVVPADVDAMHLVSQPFAPEPDPS